MKKLLNRWRRTRTRNDRKAKRYGDSVRDFHATGAVRHIYDMIYAGLSMPRQERAKPERPPLHVGSQLRERARRLHPPGEARRAFIASFK